MTERKGQFDGSAWGVSASLLHRERGSDVVSLRGNLPREAGEEDHLKLDKALLDHFTDNDKRGNW